MHSAVKTHTRRISFTLVVDDFGVKYENIKDAKHLEEVIKKHYPIKSDWKGEKHIGIDLAWTCSDVMSERKRTAMMP